MLELKELKELAKASAKASLNPSVAFSYGEQKMSAEALSKTFANNLNELGKTPHEFERNKHTIFELIEIAINEVLPVKVMQAYGQFADIKTFGEGERPVFKVRISEASKKRAKSFVTKVGIAGRYEVFKLDGYQIEVKTSAYGGASRVEWQELVSGTFSMNDYYSLILEGLNEKVYAEIAAALVAMVNNTAFNGKNKVLGASGVNIAQFEKLLNTADVYGRSTIYCTQEFAQKLVPTNADWASEEMKNQMWNTGYFTQYKGHPVIVLPQSFEDETNSMKVIDPSYCWIIPTGAEKPVKVAFEGSAQTKSFDNRDWSTEIQTYQKFGVATYLVNPGICVYQDVTLTKAN